LTVKNRSEGATALLGIPEFVVRAHVEVAREVWLEVETTVEVDALQNYLMVFRRAELARIGPLDEHFRFYRIVDLDLSYAIRDRIGRLLTVRNVPVVRHRHALWESLSEGDREERSRKNFGRFLKRWDHRHDLTCHGDAAELTSAHAAVHG